MGLRARDTLRMPLIQVVIILLVVGLLLWAVGQFPIDAAVMRIIRVVVIVAVCLWLLGLFFPSVGGIRVGH